MARAGGDEAFDPGPYRKGLEERMAQRRARTAEKAARARSFLPLLQAAFLEIDPELERLILFGSLSRGIPEREDFDIDLAVSSERYYRLVAWALDQDWKIDVVDLDAVKGGILEGIEESGEVLYEKKR